MRPPDRLVQPDGHWLGPVARRCLQPSRGRYSVTGYIAFLNSPGRKEEHFVQCVFLAEDEMGEKLLRFLRICLTMS